MKKITVEVKKDHIEAAIQWQKTTGCGDSIADNCIIQRALKDALNAPFVTCCRRVAYIGCDQLSAHDLLLSGTEIELPEEVRKVTSLLPGQWNTVQPFKFTVKLPE